MTFEPSVGQTQFATLWHASCVGLLLFSIAIYASVTFALDYVINGFDYYDTWADCALIGFILIDIGSLLLVVCRMDMWYPRHDVIARFGSCLLVFAGIFYFVACVGKMRQELKDCHSTNDCYYVWYYVAIAHFGGVNPFLIGAINLLNIGIRGAAKADGHNQLMAKAKGLILLLSINLFCLVLELMTFYFSWFDHYIYNPIGNAIDMLILVSSSLSLAIFAIAMFGSCLACFDKDNTWWKQLTRSTRRISHAIKTESYLRKQREQREQREQGIIGNPFVPGFDARDSDGMGCGGDDSANGKQRIDGWHILVPIAILVVLTGLCVLVASSLLWVNPAHFVVYASNFVCCLPWFGICLFGAFVAYALMMMRMCRMIRDSASGLISEQAREPPMAITISNNTDEQDDFGYGALETV